MPSTPSLRDDQLVRVLMDLHQEMSAIVTAVARSSGVTAQQLEMLCLLEGRLPSFGELAHLLGCDKTNITGMADRLQRRGFVERVTDDADRRVSRLRLTDAGRQHGCRARDAVAAVVEGRWSGLSAGDRAAVVHAWAARGAEVPIPGT